jgi:aldehyde dehydrogenase (NAD+)/gamma-glutamyl-gamma-aminobutyraldehyde dehydrogenase
MSATDTTEVYDGRAFIGGERREARSGTSIAAISPVTGGSIADLASLDAPDVADAVAGAARAFESGVWSRASADDRKATLLRLADALEKRGPEFARAETLSMGKPISEASAVDVPGSVATFRWYAELIDKVAGEIPATPPGSTALVTREPLGVVGAITPWNYPLEIAAWKVAPALAAGNSVVLKPAEASSITALMLAECAMEAGLPAHVLNVVTGPGRTTGDALVRDSRLEALTFTGSTATAKHLMVASGETGLRRLSLEAGGKSANLVFSDVDDIQLAAQKAAFGAFYNQGEVCSANSTILVQRGILDEFLAAFRVAALGYTPADPLDPASAAGALVSEQHADGVLAAIDEALAAGAQVEGGARRTIGTTSAYIDPAIILGLPNGHRLHSHEIFGPVAAVLPFDTEEEAVAIANRTGYGLAASVWTGSVSRALRVAGRLVAGTVSVNTVDAIGLTTPFGGFKQSGFGRDLSVHALDNYTGLKTTWIQHG